MKKTLLRSCLFRKFHEYGDVQVMTCPCDLYHLTLIYSKTGVYKGIHVSSYFCSKT